MNDNHPCLLQTWKEARLQVVRGGGDVRQGSDRPRLVGRIRRRAALGMGVVAAASARRTAHGRDCHEQPRLRRHEEEERGQAGGGKDRGAQGRGESGRHDDSFAADAATFLFLLDHRDDTRDRPSRWITRSPSIPSTTSTRSCPGRRRRRPREGGTASRTPTARKTDRRSPRNETSFRSVVGCCTKLRIA